MNIDMNKIRELCVDELNQKILVDDMIVEANALSKLPEIMNTLYQQYINIVMICDENTYEAAGKEVERLLPQIHTIVLNPENLHADEHGTQLAQEQLDTFDKVDFMIACGSGTIHDITRYHAYNRKIDFLSIPTAASVDGFVSTMAAMTWKGMKKTFTAVSPVFVCADTNIFSKAPARLTASGVGDLLGKYTTLCDWRIAHAITGEYIQWPLVEWEYSFLKDMVDNLDGLSQGSEEAYNNLMVGLLLSGLAMQILAYSRPASCCEHHCSHLWEEVAINDPIDYYHGEKVGVGMCICTAVYKKALQYLKNKQYSVKESVDVEWDLIKSCFKNPVLQEEILLENTPNIMENITGNRLMEVEDQIIEILEDLPAYETIVGWLKKVNGLTTLPEIGLDESLRPLSLRLSPYVRRRVSFMRVLKFYSFYDEIIS